VKALTKKKKVKEPETEFIGLRVPKEWRIRVEARKRKFKSAQAFILELVRRELNE